MSTSDTNATDKTKAQPKAQPKTRPMVGSLAHGLNIIMAFDRSSPEMTLTQVAEKIGMDRAGARRYLLTLASLGFVSQEGRLFRLTPKVMDLGYAYLSSVPLADKAKYYLDRIRDRAQVPVALGLLDDEHIVHVASSNLDEFHSPALTIGRRFPIAYASAGRAILAWLPEDDRNRILSHIQLEPMTEASLTTIAALRDELVKVRAQGYALVEGEMQLGVRSLAVPILNSHGQVVGSFNTFTFAGLVPAERLMDTILPEMQSAATEIGRTLV